MNVENVINLRDRLLSITYFVSEDLKRDEHKCRNKFNKNFPFNGRVESREEFDISYEKNITSFICNVLLVSEDQRLSYYMDCFYSLKLISYLRKSIDTLVFSSITNSTSMLIYKESNKEQIKEMFRTSINITQFLGKVLGYSFVLSEQQSDELARSIVTFKVGESILYSFLTDCPRESGNTLLTYNKVLRSLGYVVVLSITNL